MPEGNFGAYLKRIRFYAEQEIENRLPGPF